MTTEVRIINLQSPYDYVLQVYAEQHHKWCITNYERPVNLNSSGTVHVLMFISDVDAVHYKLTIDADLMTTWCNIVLNRK